MHSPGPGTSRGTAEPPPPPPPPSHPPTHPSTHPHPHHHTPTHPHTTPTQTHTPPTHTHTSPLISTDAPASSCASSRSKMPQISWFSFTDPSCRALLVCCDSDTTGRGSKSSCWVSPRKRRPAMLAPASAPARALLLRAACELPAAEEAGGVERCCCCGPGRAAPRAPPRPRPHALSALRSSLACSAVSLLPLPLPSSGAGPLAGLPPPSVGLLPPPPAAAARGATCCSWRAGPRPISLRFRGTGRVNSTPGKLV